MSETEPNPEGARVLARIAERLGTRAPTLDYLFNPDPARGLAYMETPKVACTAIKQYMQDKAADPEAGLLPADVHDRGNSPLPMASTLPPALQRTLLLGAARRFSFTRNPYTRVLSAYLDKLVANEWERARHLPRLGFGPKARPTLLQVLRALKAQPEHSRDIHFARQCRLLLAGDVAYDFLGSFETFAADFQRMKTQFYGDDDPNPYRRIGMRHATGAGEKVAQYFGAEEIALVQDLFVGDFELLGYSTDIAAAAEPPRRAEGLPLSADLSARVIGVPPPGEDPDGFTARLQAAMAEGRMTALRAAELFLRAGLEAIGRPEAARLHGEGIELLRRLAMPVRIEQELAGFRAALARAGA